MYKGIYIALSGATLKQTQMEIISNNLANANTLGYKKDKVSFQNYLISQMSGRPDSEDGRTMSDLSEIKTDFTDGSMVRTGNNLDIAIDGRGFLSIEGGQYTRRGDLKIDSQGYLVTQDGKKVLGTGGPIQLQEGTIEIGSAGDISVNGVTVGTLKIVEFGDERAVRKSGRDFFTSDQPGSPAKVTVKQGYIETSNVDVVREMVSMIDALREFQMYEKAVHSFDEASSRAVNEISRI
ncbi:MAG: flagellar basal-body rod protein FlgF [Nitrospirae bacterium]|nr:flagellar basal-body rod protein FlgF [Nitrospirota bacterium]